MGNAKNSLSGYGHWSVAELNMQLPEQQIKDHCNEAQMESNVRLRKTLDELNNLN